MTLFIVLAVLLVAGAGAYYWFFMNKKKSGGEAEDMASAMGPSTPEAEAPQSAEENFGGDDTSAPSAETPSMNEPLNTGGEDQEGGESATEEKQW